MKNALDLLIRTSPHLFRECERCGIIARWHDEEPTEICEGFYVDPRRDWSKVTPL